ncbi:class I SAM-dependent methyltransferase [Rhizobium leguminosarum]|uniref:class I SAM-dependent methyltransferase n=1 Tax=Rhizobium leguminosarum TaxID=384 RepID=UPI0021BC0A7F|nr:class I SAM-dependent methyltransferase [Rhizobium leguminosarum]
MEASDADLLTVGHREYARRWEGNTTYYEEQGLYGSLAEHLACFGPIERVVDVGCGRGQGIAALRALSNGSYFFVGIDENPACLNAAAERLVAPMPLVRLKEKLLGPRQYQLEPISGGLPVSTPIALIHADILRPDPEFEDWIISRAPFDAVTMWFTGAHGARQFDALMNELDIMSDRVHRMAIDLAAIDLAGGVLPAGRHLQIVQRGYTNHLPTLMAETKEEMEALSSHGPFSLADLKAFPYREPTTGPRIGVGGPGTGGFALSAIFRRL